MTRISCRAFRSSLPRIRAFCRATAGRTFRQSRPSRIRKETNMKKIIVLAIMLAAISAFAQSVRRPAALEFASDFQTVPVMGNTPGFGGATFQTYVALLNPTASSFSVQATLYDAAGVKHNATITLAAGELK